MLSLGLLLVVPFALLYPDGKLAVARMQACGDVAKRSSGTSLLLEDCYWSRASDETIWVGVNRRGPVGIMRYQAEGFNTRGKPLKIVDATLSGFSLPDPLAGGLVGRPSGLTAEEEAVPVHLQDVRILASAGDLQKYLTAFKPLISIGRAYTDNATFLHVPWWSSGGPNPTIWESTSMLVADSLDDLRSSAPQLTGNQGQQATAALPVGLGSIDSGVSRSNSSSSSKSSKFNYALAVDNGTFVPFFMQTAKRATSVPLLVYVVANVTLGKHPVPEEGVEMNRPVYLVGLSSMKTSLDFHMAVNQLVMLDTYSNLTMDHLVLENLAPGDKRSAAVARPISVSVTSNLWALLYDRSSMRLTVRNVTLVYNDPKELDYLLYWGTVYHSTLPYFQQQAAFLRDTMKVDAWQLGSGDLHHHLHILEFRTLNSYQFDTVHTADAVVAPRMKVPPLDPSLGVSLVSSKVSPLVVATQDTQSLTAALDPSQQGSEDRVHVLLLDHDVVWPPESHVTVPFPVTMLGELHTAELDAGTVTMDFRFGEDVLVLPADSGEKQLTMHHLALAGLAQGPKAAEARGLEAPDLWTLMLWSIGGPLPTSDNAEFDYIMLARCELLIPAPEFDFIKNRASANGSVVISLDGNGSMSGLILTGLWSPTPDSIFATTLIGSGLSASNITLKRDGKAFLSMPGGYYWPGWGDAGAVIEAGSRDSQQHRDRWVTAVAVVLGALTAAAVTAFVVVMRRRRQRRMHGGRCGKCIDDGCVCCCCTWLGRSEPGDETGSKDVRCSGGCLGGAVDEDADIESDQVRATRSEIRQGDLEDHGEAGMGSGSKESQMQSGLSSSKTLDSAHSLTAPDVRRSSDINKSEGSVGFAAVAADLGNGGPIEPLQQQQQQQQQDLHGWQLEVLSTVQEDGAGAHSSTSEAGWQRVHHLISTMSQSLQQRRLQGSLSSTGPSVAKSGSNSSGGLGRNSPYDLAGREQAANGAIAAGRAPADGTMRSSSASSLGGGVPQLQLLGVIGRGTFAMVYRALWRGCLVAVKVLHLPASGISGEGDETNRLMSSERMAVMEAVISTNMSHPNIVQVYTYMLQPLICQQQPGNEPTTSQQQQQLQQQEGQNDQQQQQQQLLVQHEPRGGHLSGWELRLLMEYCDEGALRAALDDGRLVDASTGLPNIVTIVPMSLDVACAVLHLHSEQLLHGDLKANNVLLARGGSGGSLAASMDTMSTVGAAPQAATGSAAVAPDMGGSGAAAVAGAAAGGGGGLTIHDIIANQQSRLVAKVSDFGLSLALDTDTSHVSHMHGGTLTHMSPELLLHGRASKASDVYAYGILLWEMLTGQRAFKGSPIAMLAHGVAKKGARPEWPAGAAVCPPLRALAESCWARDAALRPCFSCIIEALQGFMQLTVEQVYAWEGPLHFNSRACTCSNSSSSTAGSSWVAAAGASCATVDDARFAALPAAALAVEGPQSGQTAATVVASGAPLPAGPLQAAAAAGGGGGGGKVDRKGGATSIARLSAACNGGSPEADLAAAAAAGRAAAHPAVLPHVRGAPAASPTDIACAQQHPARNWVPLEIGVDTLAGMGGCSRVTKDSQQAGVTAVLQEVLRMDSAPGTSGHWQR